MATSTKVKRDGLPGSLADLVASTDPTSGLWIPEDGFGRPGQNPETDYVGARGWHGDVPIDSRLLNTSLTWVWYAQANSTVAVEALLDEVEQAFTLQLVYEVVQTVDGVAKHYTAYPAVVSFGDSYDSGMVRAFMRRVTLTIPIHPIPVGD